MSFFSWFKTLKVNRQNKVEQVFSGAFNKQLKALEEILQVNITMPKYFVKAITHRSYLGISPELDKSNERLEYLGDAVLGLVVAEHFFKTNNKKSEGYLTKARAKMVNSNILAAAAKRLKFEKIVLFDKRYINESEKGINTIIADTFEAIIAAIYLNHGLEEASRFIHKNLINPFIETEKFLEDKNYKGQLLEFTHAKKFTQPVYKLVNEEGPEHAKIFTINVFVDEKKCGEGKGKNKKEAEQNAAKNALLFFHNHPN